MSAGIEKKQNETNDGFKQNANSDKGMKQVKSALNSSRSRTGKAAAAFRTISEVAEDLGVQQHVLRFWETKFPQVKPLKRGGGRRYYRPEDISLLKAIHNLLYTEGYTIKGVQKLLREVGKRQIIDNFSSVHSMPSSAERVEEEGARVRLNASQDGVEKLSDKQRKSLETVLEELKEIRGMVKKG